MGPGKGGGGGAGGAGGGGGDEVKCSFYTHTVRERMRAAMATRCLG